MIRDNPPRLNVEITEEQDVALRKLIPWGMKHHLFSAIIDALIEVVQEHGEMAITAIACGKVSFIDVLKGMEKENPHGSASNFSKD
jgi:hypothetical protein